MTPGVQLVADYIRGAIVSVEGDEVAVSWATSEGVHMVTYRDDVAALVLEARDLLQGVQCPSCAGVGCSGCGVVGIVAAD